MRWRVLSTPPPGALADLRIELQRALPRQLIARIHHDPEVSEDVFDVVSAVDVNYATADGTALAGSDYTPTSGTLMFAAGETSKTISVSVVGERLTEADETFNLNLSNPTNAVLGDGQAAAMIANDDFDPNNDGTASVADVIYLLDYLFGGGPNPMAAGDANGDGVVDIRDVFYVINYLFASGPAPLYLTPSR